MGSPAWSNREASAIGGIALSNKAHKNDLTNVEKLSIREIKELLEQEVADELYPKLLFDSRKGVKRLAAQYEKSKMEQLSDEQRVKSLYAIEDDLAQSYEVIAGVDEAGRGPLAGPVVAAAVVLPSQIYIKKLNDSKKLSAVLRESLFKEIKQKSFYWSIASVSAAEIDRINILQASLEAMKRSVAKIEKIEHVLVDGKHRINNLEVEQTTIISGDARCACIAAASVLAKVYRDDIMSELDKMYPVYGFKRNKGYPSKDHLAALLEYGPCPEHRISFEPIKSNFSRK